MFAGKKCTIRCKNSISILQRQVSSSFESLLWALTTLNARLGMQEKAAKLSTCVCDGSEDYDCPSILENMDRLCHHKTKPAVSSTERPTMPSFTDVKMTGEGGGPGVEDEHHPNRNHYDGRARNHPSSGHHPGQHHGNTRPHHPHHHNNDDAIDTNEVDIMPRHPSRKSGATPLHSLTSSPANLLLLVISAAVSLLPPASPFWNHR